MSPRELIRRCLVAAVGGLLAALALLLVPPGICGGPACLIVSFVLVPALLFGAGLLAWILLALGRVRPSWPVALVGPLAVLSLLMTVIGRENFVGFFVAVPLCYAYAALVTADGWPLAWRVALASPGVVLFAWGVVLPIVL